MRRRPSWPGKYDESILEFFAESNMAGGEPVALPPGPLWKNLAEVRDVTDKQSNTFSRRMNQMADAGLLEKMDEERDYYVITDKGRAYLSGDLDAEELERED